MNSRARCRQFGISPKTGYKLLHRYAEAGEAGLADQSRRPRTSPRQTSAAVEAVVLALRDQHPAWGARKLRARLLALGRHDWPRPSTITARLHRHQRLDPATGATHHAWQRFEPAAPSDLWHRDFKGYIALRAGRCHPLTVLDDHSRYVVCLEAGADEQTATVQQVLTTTFRQ